MRGKKHNIILKSIIGILILTLLLTSIPVTAQEYELSVVDTKYSQTKEETVGGEKVVMYDVFITIANQGTTPSDEIKFTLTDDEDFTVTKEYTFEVMETKTITFENHPLTGTGDHELTITYAPTNTSITKTNANSGSETITVSYTESTNTDTPFIHPLYLLSLFIIVGLFLKKKKRS
jgi:hypothetical protein